MQIIKTAADIIKSNLHEARKYIDLAYAHKSDAPLLSDWARKMAKAHIDFNIDGHNAVKRLIDDYHASGQHSDLAPGMMAMFKVIHADLIREEAELSAMLQNFK